MDLSMTFFWLLALISVGSAIAVIANKNPVRSALFLVTNMIVLAVFYVVLSAQFIAAVQVIVYAGAIMVLFLFTIMLLNMGGTGALRERGGMRFGTAALLGIVLLTSLLGAGAITKGLPPSKATPQVLAKIGTVEEVGKALYDPSLPWLFPFEVTSILLLVGAVGAIVMAKRRR